jgi:hypothetical protein
LRQGIGIGRPNEILSAIAGKELCEFGGDLIFLESRLA